MLLILCRLNNEKKLNKVIIWLSRMLSVIVSQILLVTTSRHQDLWIVPGGGIEPTEDPRVAALREVHEEAGVRGTLGRCLGVFEVYTHSIK